MRIAVDAHGGDFGLEPNIEGAAKAARDFGLEVVFVGDADRINAAVQKFGLASDRRLSVMPAACVAGMGAEPVQELKDKPDCSVMVCADLVKRGKADALVSAGNSGATMVAAFLKLGRIKGIPRPAIAVPLPTAAGVCLLLDAGANVECKPLHLLHFAAMGSVYAREVLGLENPSVGVLSVGEEESKGNALVKETIPLLKQSGLNYKGPVEGRDIPAGTVDVVVCDGFTGNIALKLYEGAGKAVVQIIRQEVEKRPLAKLGMLLALPAFRAVKSIINPDRYGGAPLLGVDGVAVISHGRSNSEAMHNAVRCARHTVKSGVNAKIRAEAARIGEIFKSQTQQ
ncbi:MAG: phosphate acyltransferase PlsX [Elusimicrobiales bacterium]|nr:phosphate acyltransferase PlsX [Elusimicrobiales bacterium]